jgi:hypothetical protein
VDHDVKRIGLIVNNSMIIVEMYSSIFRRNTRKGGGCMRGGLTLTLNNLQRQLTEKEANLEKAQFRRNRDYHNSTVRYKGRNTFLKEKIAAQDVELKKKKQFVNLLRKKVINETAKAKAITNANAAAAAAKQTEQNAKTVAAIEASPGTAPSEGFFGNLATAVTNAVNKTKNAVTVVTQKPANATQAINAAASANATVSENAKNAAKVAKAVANANADAKAAANATAKAAANARAAKLQQVSQNARKLSEELRALANATQTTTGGRNRRTRRK